MISIHYDYCSGLKRNKVFKRLIKQTQQALIDMADYAWSDPKMGIEVENRKRTNVEVWINRVNKLEL